MLNFRQKLFIGYLFVFLLLLAVMTPVSSWLVRQVAEKVMENRALELITKIQSSEDEKAMIARLKEMKPFLFFRITLINSQYKVLYDSHTKKLLGPTFQQSDPVNHPEVIDAFKKGVGYTESYSTLLSQKFAYTAVAFDFKGETLVMRTAFPYRYLKELMNDFEVGIFLIGSTILVLFSLLTWFIIHYLTNPIQAIISAVALYKEGERAPLPELMEISSKLSSNEDVGKLVRTLMSLSERLQNQINTLRQERNEKEVLLESLVEGVVATDESLNIQFVNEAAVQFFNLSRDSLMGHPFQSLKQEKAYQMLLRCQTEGRPVIDTLHLNKDGGDFFLDAVAVPKRDNTGVILVMLDKSDHYRILEMKKDFIANASHELKTPITIIRGYAETLMENPDLGQELYQDVTSKIVKNCERMAVLVRDLLALADIENIPSSRIRYFDLMPLIDKILPMITGLFPEARIRVISSEKQVFLEGDPDLIEMALMNLMNNAAKYSTPPADITIRVERKEREVSIVIEDKGIGIPHEDLSRIFERFYRVDKAHSRRVGGSGLGLSIVETVVKKHFGTIHVESVLGKGSSFTMMLPLKRF